MKILKHIIRLPATICQIFRKFIVKMCKKILCYYNEHVCVTKTVLTYTKTEHDPYLRHDDKCSNCGISLGMRVERVDNPIKREGKVDFYG